MTVGSWRTPFTNGNYRDKAGRSIPAPGRGALTIAREVSTKHPLPILDINYRARQLVFRRKQISEWLSHEQTQLKEELEYRQSQGDVADEEYFAIRIADLEAEARRQEKEALATYGMLEGADPRVAPLRRALAVWGLTADDIGVLSIHGTSTAANEANETHMWNDIFTTISRTKGNAVPIMAQKSLLGHAKGGAAAWQLAGLLHSVGTGIIPGNRNNDNVDAKFQHYSYLMFPSKTIHTDGVRAGVMVRSCGISPCQLRANSFISSLPSVSVKSAALPSSSTLATSLPLFNHPCTSHTGSVTTHATSSRTRP